jgi:Ca2+/H+ antiporter, TMEM165/GDT1 family
MMSWSHIAPAIVAAFCASLVEFVEALTVVLAVGLTRGWRGALAGAGAALTLLLVIVAVLGPALTLLPLRSVQLGVGMLILLFGMRWLRKAILRSAGVIALHDEAAAFEKGVATMRGAGVRGRGIDKVAFAAAMKITLLEGTEVVFIVIAVGAGGVGLLLPASLAALAALVVVVLLGLIIHKPLSLVPENTLKFGVGVLLMAFGTFWIGEGIGVAWPGGDLSVLALIGACLVVALGAVPLCRRRRGGETAAGTP